MLSVARRDRLGVPYSKVKVSPGGLARLVCPATVARTSAAPALRGGDTTEQVVFVLHCTLLARAVPNLNVVAPVPGAKPVPFTVTLVPPAVEPDLGLTPTTVGGP